MEYFMRGIGTKMRIWSVNSAEIQSINRTMQNKAISVSTVMKIYIPLRWQNRTACIFRKWQLPAR